MGTQIDWKSLTVAEIKATIDAIAASVLDPYAWFLGSDVAHLRRRDGLTYCGRKITDGCFLPSLQLPTRKLRLCRQCETGRLQELNRECEKWEESDQADMEAMIAYEREKREKDED